MQRKGNHWAGIDRLGVFLKERERTNRKGGEGGGNEYTSCFEEVREVVKKAADIRICTLQ
jgi:hypothetical protein